MDGIEKKLDELGKPYGMASKDLKPDFDACKKESGATDLAVLGMVKKRLEDTFGLLKEKPAERPPTATEPAPTSVAEPEIKELLEGEATERSRIASIEIKKSAEVFGDKAKRPDADVLILKAENDADLTMGFPKGMSYSDGKWSVINKVQAVRSTRNKLSKFGAFLRKYGQWPTVGFEVETDLDDDGFARIVT